MKRKKVFIETINFLDRILKIRAASMLALGSAFGLEMAMAQLSQPGFRFGDFSLYPVERRLLCRGESVALTPKVFDTLLLLVTKAGHLVEKEAFLKQIWPDAFVEESSLAQNISVLRRVLGDDSNGIQFIETVPKRGYRFVAKVMVLAEESASDGITGTKMTSQTLSAGPTRRLHTPAPVDRQQTNGPQFPGCFHSLAVLPFTNGSGPPEAEYLSEGISESIINLLSQFPDLRVIPRTSAFRYKGPEIDLKKIGRDLKVDVVLTGTVVQRRDRLIVQTELIDMANDAQIWGGQYNRELDDIFQLQEELARRISESLRPHLTPEEDRFLTRRPTENREAYHLYLKAMYFANKWSPDGIQKGIVYSNQAIEVDPLFATAYAGLAYLYILVGIFGGLQPLQAFPMAKAAAQRALEIDDTMATAHACLAYILLAFDWDWAAAEKESCRAIELAPQIPAGHYVRSQWCLVNGQPDEAIAEARKTLEIDPLSPHNYQLLAGTYHMLGDYDSAIEQCHKALELASSFIPARELLALSCAYSGRHQEAIVQMEKVGSPSEGNSQGNIVSIGIWGIIHALGGRCAEARASLAALSQHQQPYFYVAAHGCAAIHALLGDKDEAIQWIEKALPGRGLFQLNIRPEFKTLRTDSRFGDLLRRTGLPETRFVGALALHHQ